MSIIQNTIYLYRSIKEMYKVDMLVFCALVFIIMLNGIFPAVFIKVTSNIIQTLSDKSSTPQALTSLLMIWGVIMLSQNLCSPAMLYLQSILSDKLTFHINSEVIKKANSFESIEIFDNEDFHNNLEILKSQASHKPLNMIVTVVGLFKDSLILSSCLFLLYSVLGIAILLILFSIIINAYFYIKIQNTMWRDALGRTEKSRFINYLTSLPINLKHIKELRFFNYASFVETLHKKHFTELYSESKIRRKAILLKSIAPLIITSSIIFFFIFNITTQISQGVLALGVIALIIQSMLQLQMSANLLCEQIGWLSGHMLFFEKYFSFMDTNIISKQHTTEHMQKPPFTIEFIGVDFSYNNKNNVLNNINFKIYPNDKIAIVGANGAGKSSFVKLLCGLYLPSQGQILINGQNLSSKNLKEWRSHISPVFQDFSSYDFTLAENISCTANNDNLIPILKKAEIDSLTEKLDYKVGKSFGGIELSQGQWQKVAIARALYNDGEIFILDEPTASLDPNSEYEIFKKFKEISVDKTVIFVTHRLSSVIMADKIIFMDSGRILDSGSHSELMNRCSQYKNMFEKQSESYVQLAANN